MSTRLLLAVLLTLPGLAVFATAQNPGSIPGDWPQYRGPDRSGFVADDAWSSAGADVPLWTVAVGRGYSCPSVVGDRLVTMGFFAEEGVDAVVCLDATTGEQRWRFTFEATDAPRFHDGGTLSTPTVRDGIVYCLSRDGRFHALSLADGELVWKRDYAQEFGLGKAFHGFTASPILVGDRMVLQFAGVVAVVSATDGAPGWRSDPRSGRSYSNPSVFEHDGRVCIAAVADMEFLVLDLETGEVLHEYPWTLVGNAVHCATPLVIDSDRIFLSSAYNKGCALLKLGEAREAELVWAHRRLRTKVTAAIRHGDHLYGFDESMLRCGDLAGEVTWRKRGLGLGAMTIAGDRMLVLSSDGELIVAEARPDEYVELSRRKVLEGGVYWTCPVLVRGLVYVRNSHGDLVCLDHRILEEVEETAAAAEVAEAAEVPERRVPPPAPLFAAHREFISGSMFKRRDDKVLQMRGTWTVLLRGVDREAMTLTVGRPDRWHLALDDGALAYGHDGELSWAVEPGVARVLQDELAFEAEHLFALQEFFAPRCPEDAVTEPEPVRFAEADCWKVTAPLAGGEGHKSYYFALPRCRLHGTDGDGLSTFVFEGGVKLGPGIVPATITRFRVEDGQEHVLHIESARWIDHDPEVFAAPGPIVRMLRTPEQIEAANGRLRTDFAAVIGSYREEEPTLFGDAALLVEEGDLWFTTRGGVRRFRIDETRSTPQSLHLDGPPAELTFESSEAGTVEALVVRVPPGIGPKTTYRLPRVDD